MFSKIAIFFAAFMAIFVAALPTPGEPSGITNSCNSDSTYCCNSVQDANSKASKDAQSKFSKLDFLSVLAPISGNVGLTCSPITAVGIAGTSCTTQKACCTGNNFSGLLVVGCSPINANV